MRFLASLIGAFAFVFVLSDMWQRAFVPVGFFAIPPLTWFALLLILGLFRTAFMSNAALMAMAEADAEMDGPSRWGAIGARFVGLFVSYGLFRLVEAVVL